MVNLSGIERATENFIREFRYSIRALRRAPGFTLVAGLMLALGIGATSAIFSVVNGVLIKPLPYRDAEALISLKHAAPGITTLSGDLGMSAALLSTYRDENRTFQEVGIWLKGHEIVTGGAEPEEVESLYVSDGTLRALAVQPAFGRWFSPDEYVPGSQDAVILTHGYWQQRYGSNSLVIGEHVTIDGRSRTVIGVMPAGFRFLNVEARLILPLRFRNQELHLGGFAYQGVARLKPGVTLQQADVDAAHMISVWLNAWNPPPGQARQFFASMRLTPAFRSLKQDVAGDVGSVLWVLLGTIGVVLLIACANVANLLLVRAEGRQHQVAIRAALGAGWSRLAGEMLIESLVLALLGGAIGLAMAFVGVRLFVSAGPATLPRLQDITIDPSVLILTLVISLLSGVLFGIIPVVKHANPNIIQALRAGGRTSSDSKERHWSQNTLVVVQIALAVVLLVGSGLMIRTFVALRAVQLGFADPEHVQLVRVSIPSANVENAERVIRMQADMRERLAAIPGVSGVSFASAAPMEPGQGDVLIDEDQLFTNAAVQPIRRFKFIATSLGSICTTIDLWPSSPTTWRARCGGNRRRPWGSAYARARAAGAKSSASLPMCMTTGLMSRHRRSSIGRS
jgi:putative ABC transport system permease protein